MSLYAELEQNRERFTRFNSLKYQRFQSLIPTARVRTILNSIPVLLSVNSPKLPGYVSGAPCGIARYEPDSDSLKFLKQRYRLQDISPCSTSPVVEMLAVMGSIGTVAYTKGSDFDYWVVIDSQKTNKDAITNFRAKVTAVQQWAMKEAGVEVHLFVNDIDLLKRHIFDEDEDEAFGSTAGALLIDEFYRTSIVVAGRVPFWWVVPRFSTDREYADLLEGLDDSSKDNYVDIGNLHSISKEDFVGAALFQIIKSLGNPFKSILKIGLLEKYLFYDDTVPLLSQKVKWMVHRDEYEGIAQDGYLLLFEEVYDYYAHINSNEDTLNILKMNLYLKIAPQLSLYSNMKEHALPYKVQVMRKYASQWNWDNQTVSDLDSFDTWDYSRTMKFWNGVRAFMLSSYQSIAKTVPNLNLSTRISESDMLLLARKLKSHFSVAEGKIDDYITFMDTSGESLLYIEPVQEGISSVEWVLFKRETTEKGNALTKVITREKDLPKLLAWMALNQVYSPRDSRIFFKSGYERISNDYITNLLKALYIAFTEQRKPLRNNYFLETAFTLRHLAILNFGQNNEGFSLHHIYRTSWGEAYITHYSNPDFLIDLLEMVLKDGLTSGLPYNEYCTFFHAKDREGTEKELERTFNKIYNIVMDAGDRRVVAFLAGQYLIIEKKNGVVQLQRNQNFIRLLTSLSVRYATGDPLTIINNNPRLKILKQIYDTRSDGDITTVYEETGDHILVYITNESGNIFTFIRPRSRRDETLIHTYHFIRNTIEQVNSQGVLPLIPMKVQVYHLSINRTGTLDFSDHSRRIEELYLLKYSEASGLQASVRSNGGKGEYSLSIYHQMEIPWCQLSELPGELQKHTETIRKSGSMVKFITIHGLTDAQMRRGSTLYFLEKFRLDFVVDKSVR